jgi:hypothetical protein
MSPNNNREKIYIQQAPIAASGFSSQAFAPHYPHTERKTETKNCATILDFSDKFHPIGSFHAKKRMTCYRQLGCIFQ